MRQSVRYLADIPVLIHQQGEDYACVIMNVSLGGIACKGETALPVGSLVSVSFPLLKPVYIAEGEVVWCREIHDTNDTALFELGIENRGARDHARLRMVEQISHIEHYRNEVKLSEGRVLTGEEAAREWMDSYG
ncbi:MAG TPA: PilZ domain-containing protein [Gammaproteobacteria bacterium]|nr:PilZ domain-containing protein [Gammaproteobacteria bacterium]